MKLKEIIDFLKPIQFIGDPDIEIEQVKSSDDSTFGANSIGWSNDKNLDKLQVIELGTFIVSEKILSEGINYSKTLNLIIVSNPRATFSAMLTEFFAQKKRYNHISPSAIVDVTTIMNISTIYIGNNVVIEENCSLGDFVYIDHNTIIKSGSIIKNNVSIGANCTIGGVGFGYEQDENGQNQVIPHIGNVILHDNVEIGNNVCIDRAVLGSTLLNTNVKVDNLVHIAHGVQIGKNSLIIANAMIAGSVVIGENVWISPSSSIRQKLDVADGALVGLGSVVVKNVEKNSIVAGVPAKKMN
jgi:UDP-3-O-[3-hydroxymyristoyl] glucosamine N-acyltransferase